ncbi:MAG: hypothetical protein HN348_32420 [Proteobacteria bacterium]|jgi:hypothetical protein|nr:hypothetical protein [Pseudomonadota bacterium]
MSEVTPVVADLLLKAMTLVVGADDKGHEEETRVIGEAFQEIVGRPLSEEQLAANILAVRMDMPSVWQEVEKHRVLLLPEEKDVVLLGVVKTCIADSELQDEELVLLTKLARSLDIPGKRLRGVMQQAWRQERQKQKSRAQTS